jgi:hypothetical protein
MLTIIIISGNCHRTSRYPLAIRNKAQKEALVTSVFYFEWLQGNLCYIHIAPLSKVSLACFLFHLINRVL